ncbi:MAG: phosphorylase [Methylomonas sp.]|nr:phosphorylase [Methylomonas sp.]
MTGHLSKQTEITGIITALPQELATLTRLKPDRGACVEQGKGLLLAWSGMGPAYAEITARHMVAQGVRRLVSWGCAAALSPQLKPGDLVIASRVGAEQSRFDTDRDWTAAVLNLLSGELKALSGAIACSDRIVANNVEKQAIFSRSQALALDMESAAIAAVASEQQLPFLAVRAIADPADMTLPDAVARSLKADGTVDLLKVMTQVAWHPGQIPALIRLGLHFGRAQTALKQAARHLERIVSP